MNLDRIRALAREKGIKIKYICAQLGLSEMYFVDIKRKNRDIPEDRLTIIADILDTTTAYLRGETDIKEKLNADMGDELVHLSDIEKTIMERVRLVPEDRQEELIALIDAALKMQGLL